MAPDAAMLDGVRALRGARRAHRLLSNSWGDALAYDRGAARGAVRRLVISSEVGLRKPYPAIYALAAERLGLPPSECVFVDDLPRNLKPARALGMATVLHRGDAAATLAEIGRASEIVAARDGGLLPADPGIDGESADAKYEGWLDVTVLVLGRDARPARTARRGRRRRQGPDAGLPLRQHVSKASPKLFLACASGQHIKEAELVGRKAGKEQQEFLSTRSPTCSSAAPRPAARTATTCRSTRSR